ALTTGGFHLGAGQVALLIAAMLGGACLFAGLFVIGGTLSFWTVETLEIMATVTYGGVEATQFPLSIYRPWFRSFFTFVVPLACVNFLPAQAILGLEGQMGAPSWVSWLAPLAGVAFLVLCLRIWRIGVRHYSSTGS
ncbi:MAG: ABC transporter permease, partial [Armatimonadia bacterium]|nr:ABC transporter permease [Armatimonadia bacterium]